MRKLPHSLYLGHALYACSTVSNTIQQILRKSTNRVRSYGHCQCVKAPGGGGGGGGGGGLGGGGHLGI